MLKCRMDEGGVPPKRLPDGSLCFHEGENATYCTRCWLNLYEARQTKAPEEQGDRITSSPAVPDVKDGTTHAESTSSPPTSDGVNRSDKPSVKSTEEMPAGCAVAILVVGGLLFGIAIWKNLPDKRVVAPNIPALAAMLQQYGSLPDGSPSGCACQPKLVILDKTRGTLHPLQRDLPRELAAQEPRDVHSVIWIETDRAFSHTLIPDLGVGQKYDGPVEVPAYRATWRVKLLSLDARTVCSSEIFSGARPPQSGVTFQSAIGSKDQIHLATSGGGVIPGAEVIFGDKGKVQLKDGRRVVGVVGASPWEETMKWIRAACQ